MQVSETVLHVDLAVHPTENWPVVVAVTSPFTVKDDPRAVIRVFDPRTRRWRVTAYGRHVMKTSLYLRDHHFPNAYAKIAA